MFTSGDVLDDVFDSLPFVTETVSDTGGRCTISGWTVSPSACSVRGPVGGLFLAAEPEVILDSAIIS